MDQATLDQLVEKAGSQFKKEIEKHKKEVQDLVEQITKQKGFATEEQYDALKTAQEEAEKNMRDILEKQGVSLTELQTQVASKGKAIKSIPEVLKEHEQELRQIHAQGMGVKQFMLSVNGKGETIFQPHDVSKVAGPTGTVDGLGEAGTLSSVITNISSQADILRIGGGAGIVNNYTNSSNWLFDLINVTNAGFDRSLVTYWEELPKEGTAAVVAEGATKPLVQYRYVLRSQQYKKYAHMITFTDEFDLDFRKLHDDIMFKGRRDITAGVNSAVLTDVIAQATAYNTASSFGTVPNANDYDAIAAMAAQVDNATYGNTANAAVMSTFKKYRMGVTKDTTGGYLNRPGVIDQIRFVGNPAMGDDAVVVGDLKQYNLILRGGLIVKIGYNGTDFSENKYSVVMEQFYFNYISEARKSAIVKGPNFADVKTAINEPEPETP